MSSSKKTSSKSRQSPAPATKSAAKPAPRKAPPRRAPRPAAVSKTASVPVAAAPVKVRPAPAKLVTTVITARVDVGFGNALFIRGEGPGLSWDSGVALECVEADLWRIILPESHRGFTFKFLVNDLTWNTGPDYVAEAGAALTFTPRF